MAEPYKKLTDNFSELPTPEAQPVVINAGRPLSDKQMRRVSHEKKAWKAIKILAFIQLAAAILIFLLGTSCVGISNNSAYHGMTTCEIGSGIWVGVISIVASSLGVAVAIKGKGKCLLISYMVMAIIAAVLNGILIIFTSASIAHMAARLRYRSYGYYNRHSELRSLYSYFVGMMVLNCVVLALGLIHMISCIVSSSLICYKWTLSGGCCCAGENEAPPTVVYVPAPTAGSEAAGDSAQKFVLVPMSFVQQQGTSQSNVRVVSA